MLGVYPYRLYSVWRLLSLHRLHHGFTGKLHTELLEYALVYIAQHHRGMNLTVAQFRQLLQGATAVLVLLREYRQGDNHFICVQTRVVATQVTDLGVLDRLYHRLRDELQVVVYASEMFW